MTLVGKSYDKQTFNCATTVCAYYRSLGIGNLPDGDLSEYTFSALLWIKNNFKKIDEIEKHCLLLNKNVDGTLHVGVYDGRMVLHANSNVGQVVREPLWSFRNTNKNIHLFKWKGV